MLLNVLTTLEFMHESDFIHRDVKPDNIFVHECKDSQE
jgi:serine/threonine protein kinase